METGIEVGGECDDKCSGNKTPVTDNGVWLSNSLELRLYWASFFWVIGPVCITRRQDMDKCFLHHIISTCI